VSRYSAAAEAAKEEAKQALLLCGVASTKDRKYTLFRSEVTD